MNEAQVLDRLTSQYAALPAPAPSAALLARMDAGRVGEDDDSSPGAVVVPLVRPRARVRYLVAAMVAGFVVFSGLAAAGALPDPLQREVSSLMSHVGIDIPSPDDGHAAPGATESDHSGRAGGGSTASTVGSGASTPSSPGAPGSATGSTTPTGGAAPPANSPVDGVLGIVGGITGGATTTTVPPGDGLDLPPITTPPDATLPPVTVGPITLPPTTLPPVTIPTLPLPPLPIPGL